MTFLRAVLGGGEERGRALGDGDDLTVVGAHGGRLPMGGSRELAIPAYYAGVEIIAGHAAMTPVSVLHYDQNGRRTRDLDSRVAQLLGRRANAEMHIGDVLGWCAGSIKMRGNAYLWRERNAIGQVVGYIPLNPARVQPLRIKGRKVYLVSQDQDSLGSIAGTTHDILHIRGSVGFDGLKASSPVQEYRALIGEALNEQRYQASLLENGVRPSGFLSTDGTIDPDDAETLKKKWAAAYSGVANAGRVPVLEHGLKWEKVSLSAADAQFLELRQFTRQEVAVVLHLPAQMLLAGSGSNLHYDSADMDMAWFARHTMAPLMTRICRAISIDDALPWGSVSPQQIGDAWCEPDIDAISEADPSARYANYKAASWFLVPNDAREREGLAPVEGGDKLIRPNVRDTPRSGDSE